MAKDGTMRGGARVGSGRKSKALTEKIDSGLAATVIDLPEPAEFNGEDVPPVKDFLKATQKSGILVHAQAHLTDRDAVIVNGEVVLISEVPGMARVQVDERRDSLLPAVLIDGVGIVGGIQEELLDTEFRKVRLHGEEGMQEGEHVMPGGPLQEGEYREVAAGIGGHVHVEVVAEEIAFPVGVPAPVTVRLGIAALAMAGGTALFLAVAEPLLALLCGGTDGRAVTGKGQMGRIDQASADGTVQELLPVEPEDKGERIPWLQAPAFQQRKEPGSRAGRIAGSLLAFLLPLGRLHLREAVFWGKVAGAILPDAGKEIIKSLHQGYPRNGSR